jgi:5-methylthioadenosine/S-adenosylhomocysteine deaminase
MLTMLIRNGHVIAEPQSGDYGRVQSVLIGGGLVTALGEDADARRETADEIIDATGRIILPGLVNAHMHSWQTLLRGMSLDWNLLEYLGNMHGRIMQVMTPEDVYLGNLAAALTQIAAGTTSLGDWCHANPTSAHSDAAIAGLQEAGIRGVFFLAAPRGAGHQRTEVERLANSGSFSKGGLLTLGLAVDGPLYSPPEIAEADLVLAREMGLVATMHHSGGPSCPPEIWHRLIEKKLIGPSVNIVHGNTIDDDLLDRLVDAGATFTMTPEVEMSDGHGHPITGRLRQRGVAPAIGIDIESAVAPNLLTAATFAMMHQRALDGAAVLAEPADSGARIKRIEALHWSTGAGAHALGLDANVGRIAPGFQADLMIINGRALELWPNNDPVATALRSDSAHVEHVMIAGQLAKRDGVLCSHNLDLLLDDMQAASERIRTAANLTGSNQPLHGVPKVDRDD